MNYLECLATIKQYMLARIPFIGFNTVERNRALDIFRQNSKELNLPVYVHTMSQGIYDLNTGEVLCDEKTIMGALDFISEEIKTRENLTFVLTEASSLSDDSMVTRYFLDIVTLAEERGACIVTITSDSIWAQLQRLGMSVTLNLPDEDEVLAIIKRNIEPYRNQIKVEWDEKDFRDASVILSGISEAEIRNVIASLIAKGSITKQDIIDLNFAKDQMFSNINGLEKIDISDFNGTFGGLDGLKKWLDEKKKLLDPSKKEEMKKRGIKPPKGVLLVGVPGCGKSLSAKVIASTWALPLYRLDFATVQGQYVGQSEKQLKEAFETAEHVSPCILWIDEIEKGLVNSKGDSGVTTRMVGQFLFWLQECKKEVFVIATANDVTSLPGELLRKGRFDEMFFVDLPDSEERNSIIKMYIKKYLKIDAPDNLMLELVKVTDGFSGADIESSVRDIAYKLVAEPEYQLTGMALIEYFKGIVPFAKSNPEQVKFIRNWGKERAVSASGKKIVVE